VVIITGYLTSGARGGSGESHGYILTASPCLGADGDMNEDGILDGRDIRKLVDVVVSGTATPIETCHGDFDGDSDLDAGDIPGMVNALLAGPRSSSGPVWMSAIGSRHRSCTEPDMDRQGISGSQSGRAALRHGSVCPRVPESRRDGKQDGYTFIQRRRTKSWVTRISR
jgi:hypothetical protein